MSKVISSFCIWVLLALQAASGLLVIHSLHGIPSQLRGTHRVKSTPVMIFGSRKGKKSSPKTAISPTDQKWVEERVLRFNRGAITATDFVRAGNKDLKSFAPAIQLASELVKDEKKKQKLLQALETYERNQNFRSSGLSTQTIGDRYELQASGTSISSGKSRILNASDKKNSKITLKAKISKDRICVDREADNMKKLRKTERAKKSKLFVEFMDVQYNFDNAGNHAIIMENGQSDLKNYVELNGPIQGGDLRKIAVMIARILDNIHRSGLVWSDCKPDNLVFFNNNKLVKAIDLEGAVPIGTKLVGFSPEVTPPYAQQKLREELVQPEFDSWSFGMVLYHLYHGQSFYGNLAPSQILAQLNMIGSNPIDLSTVKDPSLKSLLKILLEQDRSKCVPVGKLLRSHPYLAVPVFF